MMNEKNNVEWSRLRADCSVLTDDDTAEVGKSVCVRKLFVINLDWSCVGSVQCHNFSLLAADVQANLLCKGVEAMRLLLYVGVGV